MVETQRTMVALLEMTSEQGVVGMGEDCASELFSRLTRKAVRSYAV